MDCYGDKYAMYWVFRQSQRGSAFRVDHKLCKRSQELGGVGILVEKNPEAISLRSFLQDSGFHSREAPCGYLAKGLRRRGIMDTL